MRQLKGESRTAAEVVVDDALVQDDGIDWIVAELDRCWEVTQDQDKVSKIEKAFNKTERDVKRETTFMSNVARRKLNFQQLENVLGTPVPEVVKGYATLRDAKLAESSYDKVVMWTGGSYDHDDVVRALVRLDRPEVRPGTSGQSGKTVPTYFTDPEVDAPTIVPGSEDWMPSGIDPPQWNEVFENRKRTSISARTERRPSHAMERSPFRAFSTLPTMVRRQLKKTRYRRYYCRLDHLSEVLGAGPSERIPMLRRSPEVSSASRRGASGRDQGLRMKRSSIQQLKLRTTCARCRKLGHWARECPRGNRGQRNDERYNLRAARPEDNPKGFIAVAWHTERRPFFLGTFWTFVALDRGEVSWDTIPAAILTNNCNFLRRQLRIR